MTDSIERGIEEAREKAYRKAKAQYETWWRENMAAGNDKRNFNQQLELSKEHAIQWKRLRRYGYQTNRLSADIRAELFK